MRRGLILLVLLGVLIFLGYRVLSKPPRRPTARRTTTDTLAARRRTGRRAGTLERKERRTREEKRLEREKRRAERKRLREERRRRRQEERMRRKARRKSRGRKGYGYNIIQAIFYSETGSYVIIDGKNYKVGDEISGRRITKIEKDRVVIEYHGEQKSVRVGESITPLTTYRK